MSLENWTTLENFLIANGYNYDGTTEGNKIAKAMASTTGWYNDNSMETGMIGYNQNSNNSSGFNAFAKGARGLMVDGATNQVIGSTFSPETENLYAFFWSSTEFDAKYAWERTLLTNSDSTGGYYAPKQNGFSVRFVRDATTASINDYSNAITIYPNPTTSIVTLQGDKRYDIEVYTLQGKKVMALTGNTIDMSHLSSATYIVKALDKVENEEVSYKVVKN